MQVSTGVLNESELDQDQRLKFQAFTVDPGPRDHTRPQPPPDRVHVARADGRLVGTVSVLPFGQWFGGRSVPMGGVAGVAIAPEARGHGLARRLLADAIVAMKERGEVISTLYPTTSPLYRSMGYEFAGRYERVAVRVSELTAIVGRGEEQPRLQVETLGPNEIGRIRPLYDELASASNGWLDRSDFFWARLGHGLDPAKHNAFTYALTDGDGTVQAGLTITHRSGGPGMKYNLDVGGPFARSRSAFSQAIGLVSAMGTMAHEATLSLPVESLALQIPNAYLDHRDSWIWMLRIVDVAGALEARGYTPGAVGTIEFEVTDEHGRWNRGRWSLAVTDGRASVVRLDDGPAGSSTSAGPLTVDIQTLSCLYTGFFNPTDLARAGRLPGISAADLATLHRLFDAPAPRVVDFF